MEELSCCNITEKQEMLKISKNVENVKEEDKKNYWKQQYVSSLCTVYDRMLYMDISDVMELWIYTKTYFTFALLYFCVHSLSVGASAARWSLCCHSITEKPPCLCQCWDNRREKSKIATQLKMQHIKHSLIIHFYFTFTGTSQVNIITVPAEEKVTFDSMTNCEEPMVNHKYTVTSS